MRCLQYGTQRQKYRASPPPKKLEQYIGIGWVVIISACVKGSSITAITLLRSPNFNFEKISPFVKEPPTHAIAAIAIASPSNPNMAVSAIELSGEVRQESS